MIVSAPAVPVSTMSPSFCKTVHHLASDLPLDLSQTTLASRFVEQSDERAGVTMAFRYLGPVDPDGAEGERPITIEWRLRYAMPREVLATGRVAV